MCLFLQTILQVSQLYFQEYFVCEKYPHGSLNKLNGKVEASNTRQSNKGIKHVILWVTKPASAKVDCKHTSGL